MIGRSTCQHGTIMRGVSKSPRLPSYVNQSTHVLLVFPGSGLRPTKGVNSMWEDSTATEGFGRSGGLAGGPDPAWTESPPPPRARPPGRPAAPLPLRGWRGGAGEGGLAAVLPNGKAVLNVSTTDWEHTYCQTLNIPNGLVKIYVKYYILS